MKSRTGPSPVDWMRAVADCDLGKREKAVLNALIPYIAWGREDASCHPSMQTLVQASGWTERSIQGAINELERLRIVRVSEGPPGWKTLTRSLSWPALIARTPAAPAGVDGETPAHPEGLVGDDPRTPCALPPKPLRGTPAGRAPHPRMPCAQSFHRPSIEPANEQESSAHATDGMDGQLPEATRKRRALKVKGVRGRNLDRLASCPQITPELIEREWARIKGAEGVRNASAVLVRALGELARITLGSQQALAGMDPREKRALLDSQARIEQRRRDAQLAAS